jgi:hypothetical protein
MTEPVTLDSDAIYDDDALRRVLGLSPSSLATARRNGKLRYTKQGQRTLYRGAWILAWLDSTATLGSIGQEVASTSAI